MKGGLETEYDSNNRWELYEGATNEWKQRKFGNKGRVVEKVSRMNALHLAAIVLPIAFLVACGTSGTTLPIEKGLTTPLHRAAADSEPEAVTLLLDGGADIEARNEKGGTPLHVAVENNEPEVVASFLDRGADIEARTENGRMPLHVAAGHNEPEVIALLLDRGADIHARSTIGITSLHFAAGYNKPEVVALLLDRGANIEARTEDGKTPLHYAAENNRLEAVTLLLDRGVDIEARSEQGLTPLHVAAGGNKPEVAALLLDKGADIKASAEFGWTPLHVAARYNEPEVVALLLDRGADITIRDDVPSQVSWGDVFAKVALIMVRLSLEALSPNRDEEGYYDFRKRDRRKRLGEILYSPVTFNPGGNMPLHFAAGFNKPDVVALLLDEGADIKARTDFGWTPLHYAAIFSATPEVITLLLDRGADVHARDQDERTPLDYAEDNKHLKGSNVLERLKAAQEGVPIIFEPPAN